MNGKTCVVEKYITKKDKYKIIFEGSGNAALVGPNNLKRRDRTPLDCGYYITFENGRMSRREFAIKKECQAYVSSLGCGDVKGTAEELARLNDCRVLHHTFTAPCRQVSCLRFGKHLISCRLSGNVWPSSGTSEM